jgi:DNA-binding CsgD family transcriptional regulator
MSYLSPAIAKETVDVLLRQDKASVDERQREVLQLLSEGKSMKEVAQVLNLAISTVVFHKVRIRKVLHAKNDAGLVQYAVKSHLISA